jgi:transcriptional regulator with XRE-family HTH domain
MLLQERDDRQTVITRNGPANSQVATIGGRLRRLRKERNLTQAELARQIGIQQSDLSRMEKGEYRVSLDNLVRILKALDLQIADFFAGQAESQAAVQRPLSHEDMQLLHMLRELSPEARQEVQQFVEFKLRKEGVERRAREARERTRVRS